MNSKFPVITEANDDGPNEVFSYHWYRCPNPECFSIDDKFIKHHGTVLTWWDYCPYCGCKLTFKEGLPD
ncbi:MAG: hypothetical protein GY861_21985 [bacterium]|nr:hypothetical protein [bacterium]